MKGGSENSGRRRSPGAESLVRFPLCRSIGRIPGEVMKADAYEARFKAEAALQQRRYCDAFKLWRDCPLKRCRRLRACGGDAKACLKRGIDRVPRAVQWQAREDILAATPRNIGAAKRAARQCMPYESYEQRRRFPHPSPGSLLAEARNSPPSPTGGEGKENSLARR